MGEKIEKRLLLYDLVKQTVGNVTQLTSFKERCHNVIITLRILIIYFNLEIIITLCPNVFVYKTGISAYMYILQVGPNYHNVDRFCEFVY